MLLVQILSIFKERPQLAKFKYIKQFLEPVHRSFLNQFQKGNMEYLPVPKTGVDHSPPILLLIFFVSRLPTEQPYKNIVCVLVWCNFFFKQSCLGLASKGSPPGKF